MNVEIADKRDLNAKRPSTVEDGEPIPAAWPNLEFQIIKTLEDNLSLVIDLLRRGTDEVEINNQIMS